MVCLKRLITPGLLSLEAFGFVRASAPASTDAPIPIYIYIEKSLPSVRLGWLAPARQSSCNDVLALQKMSLATFHVHVPTITCLLLRKWLCLLLCPVSSSSF